MRLVEPPESVPNHAELARRIASLVREPGPVVLAIDAPIISANPSGMREADRETHRHFGRFHAGAYPANARKPTMQGALSFGRFLRRRGFDLSPPGPARSLRPRLRAWECYPHPAQVVLFGLRSILRYKKGTPAAKRRGLREYQRVFRRAIPSLRPRLLPSASLYRVLSEEPRRLRGADLKNLEDRLDALFCAYLACFFWFWGVADRVRILGRPDEGYIAVPWPPPA